MVVAQSKASKEKERRCSLELLDANRAVWRAQLPTLPGVGWHRFWRGFVGGADAQAWKFYRRHADALFAAAPVQFLRVFGISALTCRELAASPYLARLVSLELLEGSIGDEGAVALAVAVRLGRLELLDLHGNAVGQMLRQRFDMAVRP